MYSIYILRWPNSKLTYVGRTCDPARRNRELVKWANRTFPGLGIPAMTLLETGLSKEQALKAERHWILFFNCSLSGANKVVGGQGRFPKPKQRKTTRPEIAPWSSNRRPIYWPD